MMPGWLVSNYFGLEYKFWFVLRYYRLLYVLRSPITTDEEFLYGITTVGRGNLLLNALG